MEFPKKLVMCSICNIDMGAYSYDLKPTMTAREGGTKTPSKP